MANIKNIKDKDGIVYPVTKGDAVSMESGDTLQSELDKKLETVTTNDIQDGAVTSSKIGAGQVTSQNIDWETMPQILSFPVGTLGDVLYVYRWQSGLQISWRSYTLPSTPCNTAWGNLYYGVIGDAIRVAPTGYEYTHIDSYFFTPNATGNQSFWLASWESIDTDNSISVNSSMRGLAVVRPTSTTITSAKLSVFVIGRWK